jgi:WD40 repeat protein
MGLPVVLRGLQGSFCLADRVATEWFEINDMHLKHFTLGIAFSVGFFGASASAQQSPSYAKQVRPFLAKYCIECHNPKALKGGLDLETFKTLEEGSDRGPVVEAGKPDYSKLVTSVEGKTKPVMPPKTARLHPKPAEIIVLRAWVAAGTKDDSALVKAVIPDIKPRVAASSPVTALAYRPDGQVLAAGEYKTVTFIDPATGSRKDAMVDLPGTVTAVAFSPDGRYLAAAVGKPGSPGEVLLYAVQGEGKKVRRLSAVHKDVILDLTFSPDSTTLATASYDTQIKFWDVGSGKELRTLKEHSDSVYALAFSPDGKLLASAAADRAIKVWEAATGKLLYTLGEATDWLYAVAWSPDGKHLAAGGVDKSIRLYEVGADAHRLIHSVFAHQGPVTRLIYSSDGKTLYSLAEDRTVKAWDSARMVERKVYAPQPETTLALAVRQDRKQLALGRYDGVVILLDEANGTVQSEVKPASKPKESAKKAQDAKPAPPQAIKLTPASGPRGKSIQVLVEGKNLDRINEVTLNHPGATAKLVPQGRTSTALKLEIHFPPSAAAGNYQLVLKGPSGQASLAFTVDLFAGISEVEANNSPGSGQRISLPASVAGSLDRAGDVDFFRFEAKQGQQIGAQLLTGAIGSKIDGYLRFTDSAGNVLAETNEGILGLTVAKTGTYALGVRDREYRGGNSMHYRLHVGDIPIITSVFPLGLERGTEASIVVTGVNLGHAGPGDKVVRVKAPADAAVGSKLPVRVMTPTGAPLGSETVVVGEFPEVGAAGEQEPAAGAPRGEIPVPGTANGWLLTPGLTDTWRFRARKGKRLIIETQARRLGSALDSFIEVLDANNQPVARATLRSQAKTYVTFRDHDSANANIRIETWGELAVNDYLYAGTELLKIRSLPTHPDADCIFFSAGGQRTGYLDTTPTHLSDGTPMYKVAIHPPGMTFPPNGFPVITLYYRNDDGGPGFGRDSRVIFDPPADGEYRVRIGDSRAQGGDNYAYRLTVRPPRPSFNVSLSPMNAAVWKGGAIPITVNADRIDGFEDAIHLKLTNLPPGFSAPETTIPAGENSTAVALYAEAAAKSPSKAEPLKLIASALINGAKLVKEVDAGTPRAIEPGKIVTTTVQSELTLLPGGRTKLTVHIERRDGFKGRVPLDVLGMPHGVRVLDIGLNGILITERETTRTFDIYAEPWVEPTEHPIVVLARQEGTKNEHGARSVLLKVVNSAK